MLFTALILPHQILHVILCDLSYINITCKNVKIILYLTQIERGYTSARRCFNSVIISTGGGSMFLKMAR